ncbi:MAG: membrane protein insertase YidC [Armatimonadota bacterium]|nr:MAG: membrane protein insertase YidC [Armatimonadota bacterium]
MKRLWFLLPILLLPLLAGCFGAQGVPLSQDRLRELRYEQLPEIDRLATEDDIQAYLASLETSLAPIADSKDRQFQAKAARMRLLIGYCRERLDHLNEAIDWYQEAASSQYGSVAYIRIAQVAEHLAQQTTGKSRESWEKEAIRALERAANYPIQIDPESGGKRGPLVLVRRPAVGPAQSVEWLSVDVRHYAYRELDQYYKERLSYRIFDYLVRFCGGEDKNHSYLLAIALIAVLAKLITIPLSAAQFRSMHAMQALQPEIKKLQEKYKNAKQQLARAQMELFKAHKVNPASSCLPMLIQMPILIWVYYGIRHFVFRFEGVSFLYLDSLANPDVISIGNMLWPGPFLLIYGLSMYFSQKLIATPAATPEQQQQQKLMTFMMPVLLVFILKGLPAAFILYWLLQNILMTGHQYLIMRPQRLAAATAGVPPSPSEPLPAPPPEALDKLSQGTRPRKKKKKRR